MYPCCQLVTIAPRSRSPRPPDNRLPRLSREIELSVAADKVAGMARIAVIGAGMGAMAAAARLAVAGHRVAVYERRRRTAARCGRFERDGFAFDTGPGLLHLPAVYRDLFVKTGKEPLEECVELVQVDPSSRHLFADGTAVSLPNASRAGVVAALDAALGAGAGERWGDFLVRAREAWDRTRRPLLEEPLWPDWQVLAERDPYPAVPHKQAAAHPHGAGTLAEVGAWELRGPAADGPAGGLRAGVRPRSRAHAPASAAVLPYMEQTFGSWYVARRHAGAGASGVRAVRGPEGRVRLRRRGDAGRGEGRPGGGGRAGRRRGRRRRARCWTPTSTSTASSAGSGA